MGVPKAIPVVIGVGDIKNKSPRLEDGVEPMKLMAGAIRAAIQDTGLAADARERLRSQIDSLDVVATWTWPYPDLPALLASELGVDPRHALYSGHGGNQPGKLFDGAARRIAARECTVAVVTGGEALASLSAFAAAGKLPPPGWAKVNQSVESVFSPTTRDLGENLGAVHSVGAPIQVYPLYENGFRAHRGQSIRDNNAESATLYAEFAKVAEKNPLAWNYGKPAETAEFIGSISKKNRMICFPYPLLMNAFNTVNLAGACLLTSTEHAAALGVPESKWIYPLGGAGTSDSSDFWQRPNFYSSPSISASLDATLKVSGLTKDQIDLFDFYSCFPIVPKLACEHLGLSITNPAKPVTLLGGLTSFGGAGNNYSMHALTRMVRELRDGNGRYGLILANGGVLSYQHVVCLSSQPRDDGSPYPERNPLPELLTELAAPTMDNTVEGEAIIETYTVDFARDGTPSLGHIVGRLLSSGHRFLANAVDPSTLSQLSSTTKDPIGRRGWVTSSGAGDARNLFKFEDARL